MAMLPWWIHYPNVNNEIINLDWILQISNENTDKIENFIGVNTIKYADPILWDITSQYEANTIVVDPQTGDAYISTKAVPYGVALSNDGYWTRIYNYASEIHTFREQIAADEQLSTTATAPRSVDDLVFVNGLLYRVTAPMIAGDSYVVGSNCVKTTINAELLRLHTSISAEAQAREDADEALGGRIDSEAQARESADETLQNNITAEATARENAISEEATARENAISAEASARESADETLQNNISAEATARENADTALQNKINKVTENIINVGSLGLDLTEDITSDIENLINNGNKRLYFPTGEYKFSITITTDFVEIYGDGLNTTFKPTTGACILFDSRNGTDTSGAYLHDFKIEGEGFALNGIEAIGEHDTDPHNNSKFSNILIRGCSYGIKWFSRGIWLTFERVWSYGNYYGIWVETPDDCAFNQNSFNDCFFGYNQANGIILKTNQAYKINSILFNHCTIEANFRIGKPPADYDIALVNANGISFNDCYIEANNGLTTIMVSNSDCVINGGTSLVPTSPLLSSNYTASIIVIGLHGYDTSTQALYSGPYPNQVCVIGQANTGYTIPTGVVTLF